MNINLLYYALTHRPFFIDPRRINAAAVIVTKLLDGDVSDWTQKTLSQTQPLRRMSTAGGGVVADTCSFDGAPEGSVAIIPLKGDMMKHGTMCSYGTDELALLMHEATASGNIIGTVLDVDSGGGCVDAIAPMVDAIAESRQAGKPVVAVADLCASAAYYVACHADQILCSNDISCELGSIGVMTQFVDYQKYYEQRGVKVHTVYSDLSGYKNAPLEAALKGDYTALREEELNPLARKFQEAVKSRRPQLDAKVEGILNGRMFFAQDAIRHGLADRMGTLQDAVQEVQRLHADAALRRLTAGV